MNIFDIVVEAGKEFDKSNLGTLCLTKYGEQIVKIVKDNPQNNADFSEQFKKMWLIPEGVPYELLAFCMHHLKWVSVYNFVEGYRYAALQANNWKVEGPSSMVLDAYKEPWKDRDLFY